MIIIMGNIFERKKDPIKNKDLYKSLLETNINERLLYLEDKIDNIDAMLWTLDTNTTANFTVMSSDIHRLYERINIK